MAYDTGYPRQAAGGGQESVSSDDGEESALESALSIFDSIDSTRILDRPSSSSSTLSATDFLSDVSNYIPVGTIRLERFRCEITAAVWSSCDRWLAFAHPRDFINTPKIEFLSNSLQEVLLNAPFTRLCRSLLWAGWIRMEFKSRDAQWGQIRVYVLPDDVGRRMIQRGDANLRKTLQQLLSELDIAPATWKGVWSDEDPVVHVDYPLDTATDDGEQESLFRLFNNLPSPNPDPTIVSDREIQYAMYCILEGDIDGIKTKMLPYQRRSAAMMLQREAEPAKIIDPRLSAVKDTNGSIWYCDIQTGNCLREPRMYETARGGICAETMGLGKTLICLALILATREQSSQIPVEHSVGTIPIRSRVGSLLDMAASTIGRSGIPWKSLLKQSSADGLDFGQCIAAIKRNPGQYSIESPIPRRVSRKPQIVPPRKILLSTTTVVVVPTNLVRQWEHEIQKHTSGLKVLVMSNLKKQLPTAPKLTEYDIILFSRPRFEKESRDGSDSQGRRSSIARKCSCPPGGCSCFEQNEIYRSPLRDVHFKRLITDEGHIMGNSSNKSKTQAVIVVDFLQLSSRWIISGTPTPGLYGVDSMPPLVTSDLDDTEDMVDKEPSASSADAGGTPAAPNQNQHLVDNLSDEQERKDLEKLGNIAANYLKSAPWVNTASDHASWTQYVMQPRHGPNSRGTTACLQSTLEGMMIRHRRADIERDIGLPPLHQKIVYLEGSLQDKISMNLFSFMINSNAITSDRKDADYFFHPRQRKALGELVANLRQSSFFWSGFKKDDVERAIQHAEAFLQKSEVFTTQTDKELLIAAIRVGNFALQDTIWSSASKTHEMPMHVENEFSDEIRQSWTLNGSIDNPTLIGATQLRALQKFGDSQMPYSNVVRGMEEAGEAARVAMEQSLMPSVPRTKSKSAKILKRLNDSSPALAGGVMIGNEISPAKRQRVSPPSKPPKEPRTAGRKKIMQPTNAMGRLAKGSMFSSQSTDPIAEEKLFNSFISYEKLKSATLISTASSKLSYLIDQVQKFYRKEKIIIFYEADNVAYYIAQALEAIGVEHLIYAKTLQAERRSQYIVTFNSTNKFRCLLMDISQAAFGLDISSASRVYFVNPVMNRQVEAQAIKRAHRIGQFNPVYVETLVLRSSIEELIIERRKSMTADEQKRCKTVLDDQTMYDWIKNVSFVPLETKRATRSRETLLVETVEQMAKLKNPKRIFGVGVHHHSSHDPDSGIITDGSDSIISQKRQNKQKSVRFADEDNDYGMDLAEETSRVSSPSKQTRMMEGLNQADREGLSSADRDELVLADAYGQLKSGFEPNSGVASGTSAPSFTPISMLRLIEGKINGLTDSSMVDSNAGGFGLQYSSKNNKSYAHTMFGLYPAEEFSNNSHVDSETSTTTGIVELHNSIFGTNDNLYTTSAALFSDQDNPSASRSAPTARSSDTFGHAPNCVHASDIVFQRRISPQICISCGSESLRQSALSSASSQHATSGSSTMR